MAKKYVLHAEPGHVRITGGEATLWVTSSFAPAWFADAVEQSRLRQSRDGLRREVIFAVCAAESYLLEWVRDEVLGRKFRRLATYFPDADRRGVRQRWRDVPKNLHQDGLLADVPDLSGSTWSDFTRLVYMRDGFVHARASLPDAGAGTDSRPRPSRDDLAGIDHGWPVTTVRVLITELHRAAATVPPAWIA